MQLHGGKALGLCGCDGQMILAQKLDSEVDLGFVGDIKKVTTKPIVDALNNGYVPIISTVGVGEDGQSYNINADTAAARIASCLRAEKLILMTDIVGLLEDKDDDSTLIPQVNVSDVPYLKKKGIISGGMIPKIDCCVEAVRRGVKKTTIIDGRVPHSRRMSRFSTRVSVHSLYKISIHIEKSDKNEHHIEQFNEHVMQTYGRIGLVMESGHGQTAMGEDGKEYIDFGWYRHKQPWLLRRGLGERHS